MKRIYKLIIIMMLLFPAAVFAAGKASMSVPATAENGSNVTMKLTLSEVAAWNVRLTGSGATTGCSSVYADVTSDAKNTTKTFTVTCKATKEGEITFTATGDMTSQDGALSNVSITKKVTIVKPRERDTENRLSSLVVEGQKIEFDKDKTNYEIEVDYKVENLNITANSLSNKARVEINNPEYIKFGKNNITIVVTSESGQAKTYTIEVTKNEPEFSEDGCPAPIVPECEKCTHEGNNILWIVCVAVEAVAIISLIGYIIYDKKRK